MELCKTENEHQRKLTPKETSDMIKETALPSQRRKDDINSAMLNTKLNEDPILKQYNITVNLRMIELAGRVLDPPSLEYGAKKILSSREIGNKGQWDNKNRLFVQTFEIKTCFVLNFGYRIQDNMINDFVNTLQQTGQRHGIKISNPLDFIKGDNRMRIDDARKLIEKSIDRYKNVDFILAIFSGTTDLYSKLTNLMKMNFI